jgi:hypothetical protein
MRGPFKPSPSFGLSGLVADPILPSCHPELLRQHYSDQQEGNYDRFIIETNQLFKSFESNHAALARCVERDPWLHAVHPFPASEPIEIDVGSGSDWVAGRGRRDWSAIAALQIMERLGEEGTSDRPAPRFP